MGKDLQTLFKTKFDLTLSSIFSTVGRKKTSSRSRLSAALCLGFCLLTQPSPKYEMKTVRYEWILFVLQ